MLKETFSPFLSLPPSFCLSFFFPSFLPLSLSHAATASLSRGSCCGVAHMLSSRVILPCRNADRD